MIYIILTLQLETYIYYFYYKHYKLILFILEHKASLLNSLTCNILMYITRLIYITMLNNSLHYIT